jgi:hypothetical protein
VADRQGVCVYAVVSGATGSLHINGVAGERLRRTRVAGIDLIVGNIATVPRPTDAALRRYDAAVRRLMATHGSVLPARYGTFAPTLEDLAQNVKDRRDAIRSALRIVRHRVQMTVRIFRGSDRGQTPVRTPVRPRTDPGPNGVRSGSEYEYGATQGRQYLQRRAAELQIPGADPLRTAVRKWVRSERVEPRARGPLAGSIYHLVPRGAAPAYRTAVERAARAANLTVVVSGPWPPYAFGELGRC